MRVMILRYGSTGAGVLQLQQLLNKTLQHRPPLRVDGHYGPHTEAAVRFYQTSVGLRVDGVTGPDTWRALERRLVSPQRPLPKGFSNARWRTIAKRGVGGVTEAAALFFQESVRLVIDGTREPHTDPQATSAPFATHPVPEHGNAPWIAIAMQEVGQKEIHGPANNPRILEYHSTTTLRANSEETPWCSSFANWCMQRAGIPGTKSAAAISWMHWGKPSAARPGAITIIYNRKAAGSRATASGYHVAFLVEEGPSYYRLVGGNQNNQVIVKDFSKAYNRLIGYRWPKP